MNESLTKKKAEFEDKFQIETQVKGVYWNRWAGGVDPQDVWSWIEQELKQALEEVGRENKILKENLIDATGHFNKTFSTRPCSNCEYVSKLLGRDYGCVKLKSQLTGKSEK